MQSLTKGKVMRVVNRFIGVDGGYLGDFSYRTHLDFYSEYCDLDDDPYELEGTTRERFIQILVSAPPRHQAKILRGVVERFPVSGFGAPDTRTPELRDQLLDWARLLDASGAVPSPELATSSEAVERAIADAEALIESTGAPNAVDRIHTALHAYLSSLCTEAGIAMAQDAGITGLFKALRTHHPELQPIGPRAEDMTKILRSTAAILDALNPLRNRASGAHPNPTLLEPPEAMLVVNLTRSLLHFIDARVDDGAV